MTITDLIAKLEAAETGSRELDLEIWHEIEGTKPIFGLPGCDPLRYTTSLDAALTLIEGWYCLSGPHSLRGGLYSEGPKRFDVCLMHQTEGLAETAPLALCIAALKALEASDRPAP